MLHSCMNWTPATPISPHSALFTGPAIFPAFDFQPFFSSKSLPLNLFADPHPLNLYAAILYKNSGGRGYPFSSNFFPCHTSENSPASPTVATDPKTPHCKPVFATHPRPPWGWLLTTFQPSNRSFTAVVKRRSRPGRDVPMRSLHPERGYGLAFGEKNPIGK